MSMNENDLERLEAQLRSVRPAQPPADFLQRLKSSPPARVADLPAHTALAASPTQAARPAVPETPGAAEAAHGFCAKNTSCPGIRGKTENSPGL